MAYFLWDYPADDYQWGEGLLATASSSAGPLPSSALHAGHPSPPSLFLSPNDISTSPETHSASLTPSDDDNWPTFVYQGGHNNGPVHFAGGHFAPAGVNVSGHPGAYSSGSMTAAMYAPAIHGASNHVVLPPLPSFVPGHASGMFDLPVGSTLGIELEPMPSSSSNHTMPIRPIPKRSHVRRDIAFGAPDIVPAPQSPSPPPASSSSSSSSVVVRKRGAAKSDEITRSADIKRRCRTKVDMHLHRLAEVVPECIERLTPKRPFRNQILECAYDYISNLQATVKALNKEILDVDSQIDYAICENRSISVDSDVLERIKVGITKRGVSLDDLRQTQVLMRLFGGAKAFLLNQFTGKLYLFCGAFYRRFDVQRRLPDTGYPRTLGNWPGNFPSGIDAACHLPNEHVCFFSGSQFVKYDVCADHSLPGYPKRIDDDVSWPGLSFTRIDACFNWRNKKIFFFSGERYAAFDLARNCQDPGYPRLIKEGWKVLGELMPKGVDSAFTIDNRVYFVKGGVSVRYDMMADDNPPDAPTNGEDFDAHLNPLVLD